MLAAPHLSWKAGPCPPHLSNPHFAWHRAWCTTDERSQTTNAIPPLLQAPRLPLAATQRTPVSLPVSPTSFHHPRSRHRVTESEYLAISLSCTLHRWGWRRREAKELPRDHTATASLSGREGRQGSEVRGSSSWGRCRQFRGPLCPSHSVGSSSEPSIP